MKVTEIERGGEEVRRFERTKLLYRFDFFNKSFFESN
jgi:hypothetical protein